MLRTLIDSPWFWVLSPLWLIVIVAVLYWLDKIGAI